MTVAPPAADPPPRRRGLPRLSWERNPAARAHWRISQVYWLCIAFIALWLFLRASGADPNAPPLRIGPFLSILLLAAANLAVRSWFALHRGSPGERPTHDTRGWIFTVLDLLLIALGLRATGGVDSPLWIVLFVVVVAETIIVAADREAYLVRLAAFLALVAGTLPYPLAPGFNNAYLLEFTTRFVFLLFVSTVTRRLRKSHEESVRAAEAELADLRAELAAADERARLAREIHDGMGNALAASVLRLELAARLAEKGMAATDTSDIGSSVFREEAKALREAMTAVRDWTYFTRPWSDGPVLEIDRLSRRMGLPMTITGAEHLERLPAHARLAAQRIMQEALTNAAKYAKEATRAEVAVAPEGRFLAVSIADDGCGFDPAQAAGTGVGLSSMRERAEALGGSLVVDSSPGLGTTITARLPLLTPL